jgi:hypothetical protein
VTIAPDNATAERGPIDRPYQDLAWWFGCVAVGLGLTWLAVRAGARLGTASAPFLGRYRITVGPASLLAPLVAASVLVAAWRGGLTRPRWSMFLGWSYLATIAWALALALVHGATGLTRGLTGSGEYLSDVDRVGEHPGTFLRQFTARAAEFTPATRGHPPGPVLALWAMRQLGVTEPRTLGLLLTALGALTVPLVLVAVRNSKGETAARRYAPVLILAPYAIWLAVSLDGLVALLGAGVVVLGAIASKASSRGWAALGLAFASGLLLGVAALFSYAAPWLGLCVICLYFARRRPILNASTGLGALVPVIGAQVAGFGWLDGLRVAQRDFHDRVSVDRPVLWWSVISVVALAIATGPALIPSIRKMRNTPAWPYLAGGAAAVVFSIVAGLARGGVEHAWLPFFPWLTVAAVAPPRQGGEPARAPLLLVGVGAATAIVVEALLATTW